MTSITSSDFPFLVPESFHKNMVQIGKVVSEKMWFEFLYVHDLGPRSRNDLDLQYSQTFINSIRCLLQPTFRSLAAKVSEKSTVFTFSYRNVYVTEFELAVKRNFINICKISFNKRYLLYTYICYTLLLPFKKLVLVLMFTKAWRNSQSKAV